MEDFIEKLIMEAYFGVEFNDPVYKPIREEKDGCIVAVPVFRPKKIERRNPHTDRKSKWG